jgi:hypothetical protein
MTIVMLNYEPGDQIYSTQKLPCFMFFFIFLTGAVKVEDLLLPLIEKNLTRTMNIQEFFHLNDCI